MSYNCHRLDKRVLRPRPPVLRVGAMFLFLLCLSLPGLVQATPNQATEVAIQHLLDYVRRSNLVFVRNFTSHNSTEAARHINEKYRHFRDEITTPEDFIERCASKSLLTGRAYRLIDSQGQEFLARNWLLSELAAYRTRNNPFDE